MAEKTRTKKKPRLEPTDVQAAKKELLRLGRERGFLRETEIEDALPTAMITATELETFLFTLDMMNITVRLKDGTTRQPTHTSSA